MTWYPKGTLAEPFVPQEIDDVTAAFPASVSNLLPPADSIPKEFKEYPGTKWNRFISDQFFKGVSDVELDPRTGIDASSAWRHVSTILGSYQPKHEYKEAACAYLLSLWFTDVRWKSR